MTATDSAPAFTPEQKADIRRRYLAVDTSNVADVLDTLGFMNQSLAADFAPYPADKNRIAGWAYTIRGQKTPYPLGGDAEKMKACHGVVPGESTVWRGDGEGVCFCGELIALCMNARCCAAAVYVGRRE